MNDHVSMLPPAAQRPFDLTPGTHTGHVLGELFAIGCAQHPTAPAISDGKTTYSFATLEQAAQRLADHLSRCGVRCGDRVVVFSVKQVSMPIVAVAIWKLGAVYVPLDGTIPAERAHALLARLHPKAIIAVSHGAQWRSKVATATVPFFDEVALADIIADQSPLQDLPLSAPTHNNSPAYIIFTSGSTGEPKGVEISEQSLLAYFAAHNKVLQFDATSRVFSLAPFHFDVSIEDTLLPLSVGAYVFQFRGIHAGAILRAALARERVTHLIAVSTLLTLITGAPGDIKEHCFPALHTVMTGAEICDPAIINSWKNSFKDLRLFNAYGPTETTIVCMNYEIHIADPCRSSAYPIGRPLDGVYALIIDGDDVITHPEHSGELWIGGVQVMNRYFDQAEETARKVVERDGIRYYRTGDICRYDPQGEIVFLGRTDDEIKLAGRRIHLGEIRQRILGLPTVSRTAVSLLDVNGRKQIAAIIIADDITALHLVETHLATHLPDYMRPSVLAWSPEWSVTSTGKTDEKSTVAHLREALKNTVARYFAWSSQQTFEPIDLSSFKRDPHV